jgi:hypothetical protein
MSVAQEKIICIDVEEAQPEDLKQHIRNMKKIARWLKKNYQEQITDQAHPLLMPSMMELAGLHHWNILDVLEALFELKRQHYDYKMDGLDGEILLWDPLCRQPKKSR